MGGASYRKSSMGPHALIWVAIYGRTSHIYFREINIVNLTASYSSDTNCILSNFTPLHDRGQQGRGRDLDLERISFVDCSGLIYYVTGLQSTLFFRKRNLIVQTLI